MPNNDNAARPVEVLSEAGGTVIRIRLLRCLFFDPLGGGVSGSLADLSKLLPLSDLDDLLLLLPDLGGPGVCSLLSFPAGGREEEAERY